MGVHLAAFWVAALTVSACPAGLPIGLTTAFRCDPSDTGERCPGEAQDQYQCCSDDPLALELANLDGVALPAYLGRGGTGTPLFSGPSNDASYWGVCVQVGAVAPAFALADAGAQGCPVPCNPTWGQADIEAVCGPDTQCCQTAEITAEDCVFDTELGSGCWRPVRGQDIVGLGGADQTSWSAEAHRTHQDPGGDACEAFVEGLSGTQLEAAGVERAQALDACLRKLGVADQRGFCLGGPNIFACPLDSPDYRDPCEQRNDAEGRVGCD